MLKINGLAPCGGSTVEFDPWVPLKVSWDAHRDAQPLYLMITGSSGGYVELKVHPESGVLLGLTIVDLPVEVGPAEPQAPGEDVDSLIPVFDVTAWGDVNQLPPEKRVTRTQSEMTYSKTSEKFILGFSSGHPRSRVRCGPVAIEIAESGELVRLIAVIE